jgi:hypothetical protein
MMSYKKYVYKLTFPNGMVYFGASKDVLARWGDKGAHYKRQPIHERILEYGWDSITKEILYEGDGSKECNEIVLNMERSLIEIWGKSCYNYNSNPVHHPTKGKGLTWTIDGVTKTAVEWCKEYKRGYGRVMSRIRRHDLTPKQALTYPSVPANMHHDAKGYWLSLGLEV